MTRYRNDEKLTIRACAIELETLGAGHDGCGAVAGAKDGDFEHGRRCKSVSFFCERGGRNLPSGMVMSSNGVGIRHLDVVGITVC